MILGLDPLYIILLIMGAVALGLGGMGYAMWKMIRLLTALVTVLTAIQVTITRPSTHPNFTQSVIADLEAKLAAIKLADKDNAPAIAAQLVEAANTLQQVTTPLVLPTSKQGAIVEHNAS